MGPVFSTAASQGWPACLALTCVINGNGRHSGTEARMAKRMGGGGAGQLLQATS